MTWGGAGYARYTLALEQRILDGFLLREEWRRDLSNQPYFYTTLLNVLKRRAKHRRHRSNMVVRTEKDTVVIRLGERAQARPNSPDYRRSGTNS